MENSKKILITGATGFIGKFLLDEALKRGYIVYITVRKTTNIEFYKNKHLIIVEIDFFDVRDIYHKVFSLPQFDFVLHNAGVTKSLNKDDFFTVNYESTRQLIFALTVLGKVPSKFFYMSSLASYGPGEKNSCDPIDLNSVPNPVTQYGKSKLAAEKFIIEKSGFPYIIFRPTAVYGPGDRYLLQAIKLISKGIDFQIGIHHQNLTFIYVKDLARLVFNALESSSSNKAYFVSDGSIYKNRDLGNYISRCLKRKSLHVAVPLFLAKNIAGLFELFSAFSKKAPILSVEKLSELSATNWNCNIQPLIEDFNFKAEYDLEKGINETIDWYKNEGWLK
jgi:nucleoside-diphosphate-sugar epimerase